VIVSLRHSLPDVVFTFGGDELANDIVSGCIGTLHFRSRLGGSLLPLQCFKRQRLRAGPTPQHLSFTANIQCQSFREPAWRLAVAHRVDDYMYEFVSQGCFQNPSLLQQLEWLQLNTIVFGRGGSPCRHSCSTDEIAGRIVNKDFELRQTNFRSCPSQKLLLSRLELRQQRFDVFCTDRPWKYHSEMFAA